MKDLLKIALGAAAGAFLMFRRCAKRATVTETIVTTTQEPSTQSQQPRYLPLEVIRRGIKELYYKAELANPTADEYVVILHGLLVDGAERVEKYPITMETFESLKADGVPAI